MSNLANLALDGGDPRLEVEGELRGEKGSSSSNGADRNDVLMRPQLRPLHDSTITFEEYSYYADKTRAEEEEHVADIQGTQGWLEMVFPTKSGMGAGNVSSAEKHGAEIAATVNLADPGRRATITGEEWTNASRALRTATKSAIFYLITTDILGPFGLPFAFATMGWG
jgi:hypothetical protein